MKNDKSMNVDLDNMIDIDDVTGMPVGSFSPEDDKQDDVNNDNDNRQEPQDDDDLINVADASDDDSDNDNSSSQDADDSTDDGSPSDGDSQDDSQDDPSSSPFIVLINALHEKGILSKYDEEQVNELLKDENSDQAEFLMNALQEELKDQVDLYKNSLPSKIKTLIDKYEEDVPLDELLKVQSDQIRIDKIDENSKDESVQKRTITQLYKERGWSDARIEKQIKRLEDLGELEDEFKDSLSDLKDIYNQREEALEEQAKLENKQREQETKNIIRSMEKSIYDRDSLLEGVNFNKKDKEKLFKSLTEPVGVDENGRPVNAVLETRSKNPLEFEIYLHYYHQLGLFNTDKNGKITPDFSKINKVAKSNAIDDLNKALSSKRSTPSKSAKRNNDDKDAIKKNIDSISKTFKF